MSRIKFVAATNNKNKLKEFTRILKPLNIEVLTASQCGGQGINPVEDGDTFEENAVIKATTFSKALGMPALADDSGLCVDALDGAPGVYSSRYSGEGDEANNALLLKNLEGVPMEKRTARFVCAICCAYPDGRYFTVRGECEGKIGFEPKGSNGFGYDPLFIMETGESFAEISGERKDLMSHRGKALKLLAKELENNREINPPEKLEEIKFILKDCDYKVYTAKDEGYNYLAEGCFCITAKSPSGVKLYVDLEEEITLTYDAWHGHYSPQEGEYREMLEDLTGILNNRLCAFSIFIDGKWRGSQLLQDSVKSKEEAMRYMNSFFHKKFISQMKQNGAEVRCVYWDDRLTNIIKFAPNEF